jgi:hypothetical protein
MDFGVDKRENLAREIAKIAGVTSLVISLIATVSFANTPSTYSSEMDKIFQSDVSEANMWDASWVPSGFTAWSADSNIAWKWATKNNCQDYGCISAEFISQKGCPSGLYAAINWLDNNDSVVTYSNDSIPSLLAMQNAKLRFDDIEGIGKFAQMSTISCR